MTDAALGGGFLPSAEGSAPAKINWLPIFLGFGGMVIGQFMAILDIQIVAASLSQIQAGVGATADEMSWVQTIYLLAEVVIMPLTAYLCRMYSTRRFFIGAVILFIGSSILTGLSTNIEMMIALRAVQGIAGGAMIPPVFATAFTVFPPERRITANVVVGLIVTLAPTIGPTLGGHLTEWLSWRWLFFVNVPPGLLALFLVTRYAKFDTGNPALAKGIDWWGVGLMAVGLLSIQFVLEEGARDGWFQDDMILWLTVAGIIAMGAFVWRQLVYRQPIVSLAPFRDRNFSIGIVMTFVSGLSLYGGTFVLPLFLSQVQRLSAAEVGTTMLISGLTMFLCGPIAGRLIGRFDIRVAMVGGFAVAAFGTGMAHTVTADWGFWNFAAMQAVRASGVMVAMIACQQMTVSTIPNEMMKEASSLVNLTRNVGGAVGLALLSTLLTHQSAVHYADLASTVSIANSTSQEMISGLTAMMAQKGLIDPTGAGMKGFSLMLHQKALVLSFGDAFAALAVGLGGVAVLALFARPARGGPKPAGGGGH
ncbi:MAG: DHA2 family efflux MFS transporter permease subunit [Caulobacter sp.]|nr:DHA2 family efflux MFS transporter permease subunit [Caulobacter sp.]